MMNRKEMMAVCAALFFLSGMVALALLSGCTMGRGAFAGLNPFTWLKPSTYIEMHRQHEANERYAATNSLAK